MANRVSGAVRGYVRLVGGAAKSALGGEFVAASSSLLTNAKRGLTAKSCPRCHEVSLFPMEDGLYHCQRMDICGWFGSSHELEVAANAEINVHPLVYSIAKGKQVAVERDFARNSFFSWVFWGVVLLMLFYGLYWLFVGNWAFSMWIALVAFWMGLQAVRFAYRAQYLRGVFLRKPKAFLMMPSLWFVL